MPALRARGHKTYKYIYLEGDKTFLPPPRGGDWIKHGISWVIEAITQRGDLYVLYILYMSALCAHFDCYCAKLYNINKLSPPPGAPPGGDSDGCPGGARRGWRNNRCEIYATYQDFLSKSLYIIYIYIMPHI